MSTTEQEQAAASLHKLGSGLGTCGTQVQRAGGELVAVGRELRRVRGRDLKPDNLGSLRAPLDAMRASIEKHAAAVDEMRAIAAEFAAIIGVDN